MAQAVSGMEAARAWLRLCCGTWEPVVPTLTGPPQAMLSSAAGEREYLKWLIPQGAEYRSGAQGQTVS